MIITVQVSVSRLEGWINFRIIFKDRDEAGI